MSFFFFRDPQRPFFPSTNMRIETHRTFPPSNAASPFSTNCSINLFSSLFPKSTFFLRALPKPSPSSQFLHLRITSSFPLSSERLRCNEDPLRMDEAQSVMLPPPSPAGFSFHCHQQLPFLSPASRIETVDPPDIPLSCFKGWTQVPLPPFATPPLFFPLMRGQSGLLSTRILITTTTSPSAPCELIPFLSSGIPPS